ncbi:MAG: discoidin domain-containing protein [Bacillota bacterium]
MKRSWLTGVAAAAVLSAMAAGAASAALTGFAGTVTVPLDLENAPVTGAEVTVKVGDYTYLARTKDDGSYTIFGTDEYPLPAGKYEVMVSFGEYEPVTETVEVKAGEILAGVNFAFEPINWALERRGSKATAPCHPEHGDGDCVFYKVLDNFERIPYPPKRAIDGNPDGDYDPMTRWLSANIKSDHWLVVDFGQPRKFNAVALAFFSNYVPKAYSVQYEKDGQWIEVASVTGGSPTRRPDAFHVFEPVEAQRVRFYVPVEGLLETSNAGLEGGDYVVRLSEIEIYYNLTK